MTTATRVKLTWRKQVAFDKCFGAERTTWRCREERYTISQCSLPDFTLIYPAWSGKRPTYHRTLGAAQAAAEEHRNEQE